MKRPPPPPQNLACGLVWALNKVFVVWQQQTQNPCGRGDRDQVAESSQHQCAIWQRTCAPLAAEASRAHIPQSLAKVPLAG